MRRVCLIIVGSSLLGLLGIGPVAAPAFAETYSAPEVTPLIQDEETTPGDEADTRIGDIDIGDDTVVAAVPDTHEVYEVDPTREPELITGTGAAGEVDDEGRADDSPISEPVSVARTDGGGTYIADGDGAVHLVEGNRISTVIPAGELDTDGEISVLATDSSVLYVGTDQGEVHEVGFSGDDVEITRTYDIDGTVHGLDVGPDGDVYVAKGTSVVRASENSTTETLIQREDFPGGESLVDVAVGPDSDVYAASERGLVVAPRAGETLVWPSIPADSVAVNDARGTIVVVVEGIAHRVQPSEEANPILFPTRDVDVTEGEDVESGTLLRVDDDLPAPAHSIDIASDRSIGVLHSEGALDVSRDTGPEEISGFPETNGGDGSIVVGEGGTRYVLTAGRIHKFIDGEYQQTLLHGVAESVASTTVVPELTHMAQYDDELIVAGGEHVYTLGSEGKLTPFLGGDPPLPGEVRALAVDHDDGSVYVAVRTDATDRVLQLSGGNDRSDVFDGDDVPGAFEPTGMAVGPRGDLYVTDRGSSRVIRYTSFGGVAEIVGDYGNAPATTPSDEDPALAVDLQEPAAPAVDDEGNLVFSADSSVYVLPDAAKAPAAGVNSAMVTMSLLTVAAVGAAAGLLLVVRRRSNATSS